MTETVKPFAAAAATFCEWCESPPGEDASAEAAIATLYLSKLYLLATEMPFPEDFDEAIDAERSDDDTWRAVFNRCAALPLSHYSEIFDPEVLPPEESVVADLGDDMADIHRDLVGGVSLYRAGHVAEAQADCRMGFEIHWGRHAVSALRALHCWQESHSWERARD